MHCMDLLGVTSLEYFVFTWIPGWLVVFQLDDEDDEKDKGETADGVAKSKKKKKKKKKSAEEGTGQVAATDQSAKWMQFSRCCFY